MNPDFLDPPAQEPDPLLARVNVLKEMQRYHTQILQRTWRELNDRTTKFPQERLRTMMHQEVAHVQRWNERLRELTVTSPPT